MSGEAIREKEIGRTSSSSERGTSGLSLTTWIFARAEDVKDKQDENRTAQARGGEGGGGSASHHEATELMAVSKRRRGRGEDSAGDPFPRMDGYHEGSAARPINAVGVGGASKAQSRVRDGNSIWREL